MSPEHVLKRVPGTLFSVNLIKFNRALSIIFMKMCSPIYAMLNCADLSDILEVPAGSSTFMIL